MGRDFQNATIEELKAALGIGERDPLADKAAPRSASKKAASAGTGKRIDRGQAVVVVPHSWRVALKGNKHANIWDAAHHLLDLDYWARKRGLKSFPVSSKGLEAWGVDRWAKWDLLNEMEGLGLIKVERRGPGKNPAVTILVR
jgi:hypothetical protein